MGRARQLLEMSAARDFILGANPGVVKRRRMADYLEQTVLPELEQWGIAHERVGLHWNFQHAIRVLRAVRPDPKQVEELERALATDAKELRYAGLEIQADDLEAAVKALREGNSKDWIKRHARPTPNWEYGGAMRDEHQRAFRWRWDAKNVNAILFLDWEGGGFYSARIIRNMGPIQTIRGPNGHWTWPAATLTFAQNQAMEMGTLAVTQTSEAQTPRDFLKTLGIIPEVEKLIHYYNSVGFNRTAERLSAFLYLLQNRVGGPQPIEFADAWIRELAHYEQRPGHEHAQRVLAVLRKVKAELERNPVAEEGPRAFLQAIGRTVPLDWKHERTHHDPSSQPYAWLYSTDLAGGWKFHLFAEDWAAHTYRVTIGRYSTTDRVYDETNHHYWKAATFAEALAKAKRLADLHVGKQPLRKRHYEALKAKQVIQQMAKPYADAEYRQQFIDYLEHTLIPDLYDSGRDATAEEFETGVRLLKNAPEDNEQIGHEINDWVLWLQQAWIPDLYRSKTDETAKDVETMIRFLHGTDNWYAEPREGSFDKYPDRMKHEED